MAFPDNYTLKMLSQGERYTKLGDIINHASLKGDDGAGTDLAAQLEQNQAYRLHIPLCACGALGQRIRVIVDVANTAKVTNAMALEAVVYENVPESEQLSYFNNKYGFGAGLVAHSGNLTGITRIESVFSAVGDKSCLSSDSRFAYNAGAAAGTAICTITPNSTDVILLRRGARFGALGDTA